MTTRQSDNITSSCLQNTLEIIGDKWTALILREITSGPRTFSELEIALTSISPRTLSHRLNKLESEGIVAKHLYCEHPPRYRYQLTPKGSELHEVLRKMNDWGAKHSCSTN